MTAAATMTFPSKVTRVPELTPAAYRRTMGMPQLVYGVFTIEYARRVTFGTPPETVVVVVPREFPAYELKFKNTEQRSSLRLLLAAGILPPVKKGNPVFPWAGTVLALTVHRFRWQDTTTEKWVAVHPDDHARIVARFTEMKT